MARRREEIRIAVLEEKSSRERGRSWEETADTSERQRESKEERRRGKPEADGLAE